jgi:hypothetical protein
MRLRYRVQQVLLGFPALRDALCQQPVFKVSGLSDLSVSQCLFGIALCDITPCSPKKAMSAVTMVEGRIAMSRLRCELVRGDNREN